MEGKNKTLVSTSFDFQQIICQQLMARRWVEKNEKKIRKRISVGNKFTRENNTLIFHLSSEVRPIFGTVKSIMETIK